MHTRNRSAFTLFQLLVVLSVLLLLFALLLPAIYKTRAAAERTRAMYNIKQLVLALHNYHDTYGAFPPGVDDNHFSAVSKLLPFMEEINTFRLIDFKKTIDDKANAAARKAKIKFFQSEADPIKSVNDDWGATNYLFNDKVFSLNSKSRLAQITDGLSNTVGVGETLKGDGKTKATDVRRQYVQLKKEDLKQTGPNTGVTYFKDNKNIAGDRCASWMDGRFLQGTFNGRLQPNDERPDVNCGGVSGVSALRSYQPSVLIGVLDGSVRAIKNSISKDTWQWAMDPSDGNPMPADW